MEASSSTSRPQREEPTETTALLPPSPVEDGGAREEGRDREALREARRPNWLSRSVRLSVSMMALTLSFAAALTIMAIYSPRGFHYDWYLRDATSAITLSSFPALIFDVFELQLRRDTNRPFLTFVEAVLDVVLVFQVVGYAGRALNFLSYGNYCYAGDDDACAVFLPWFLAVASLYLAFCVILGLTHFLMLILRVRKLWSIRSWPNSNETLSSLRFTVGPLVFQASLHVGDQGSANPGEERR